MNDRQGPSLLELAGIGGTAAGCVAVGVGGGYWIGSATGVGSVGTLTGLGVGIVAAVAATYVKVKRYF